MTQIWTLRFCTARGVVAIALLFGRSGHVEDAEQHSTQFLAALIRSRLQYRPGMDFSFVEFSASLSFVLRMVC